MKIEHKEVNNGMVQITTSDERWYYIPELKKHLPSLTWILSHYPKGKEFEMFLKKNGENSDVIRDTAGEKGDKVHKAIEILKSGKEIKHDDLFVNRNGGKEEELTAEEYGAVISFADFIKKEQVKVILNEMTLYSVQYGFACTMDDLLAVGGKVYINDDKTSKNVYDTHIMQVSAIRVALKESLLMGRIILPDEYLDALKDPQISILQLGYTRNKMGYKWNDELKDDFNGFLIAKQIWEREVEKKDPLQKDYPLSIKL